MPTVETSIEIDAPDRVVFDVSQDYRVRMAWDPFLRELRAEGGADVAAVGSRVWARAKNGLAMTVEYVTFDRPRRVAVRMVSRSRLFERFAGSWLFEARGPGRTRAVFRYGFETRWRALRPLLERVIARSLRRAMSARLYALKRGAEDPALVSDLDPAGPVQLSG